MEGLAWQYFPRLHVHPKPPLPPLKVAVYTKPLTMSVPGVPDEAAGSLVEDAGMLLGLGLVTVTLGCGGGLLFDSFRCQIFETLE